MFLVVTLARWLYLLLFIDQLDGVSGILTVPSTSTDVIRINQINNEIPEWMNEHKLILGHGIRYDSIVEEEEEEV